MLLTQTVAPAIQPVTLTEVMTALRLDIDSPSLSMVLMTTEGAYLNTLISAATEYVEKLCGPLITQTWTQFEHHFPCEFYWWQFGNSFWQGASVLISLQPDKRRYRYGFTLELPHIQSITSLTYTDVTNTQYTIDPSTYTLVQDDFRSHVVLVKGQYWPEVDLMRGNAVQIEFVSGYGAATANVPDPIRQAIIMHIANRYENRIPDPKVEEYVEKAIGSLVANYRWEGF